MSRQIRLSGREASVLKNIGFGLGISGAELLERTQMPADELVDVLNTLLDWGYVEAASMRERVELTDYEGDNFEINPGFSSELKVTLKK